MNTTNTLLCHLKECSYYFQRLINNTLKKYLNNFVNMYLNNILIYSENLKTHCEHVCKILRSLEKALYVKKLKNRFKIQKVKFLDYVIWSEYIKRIQKKLWQSETDWH
jgi:hypothetical protein